MRILHFYKNILPFSNGGVEMVIDQIACGTQSLGVKNDVLGITKNANTNYNPIKFHGYNIYTAKCDFELASNGFSFDSIQLFKRLAADADLIHFHFPWPFADLVHVLVKPKKPTVLTYHSDIIRQKILHQFYSPLKVRFLNSIDQIVTTSINYLNTSKQLEEFRHKISVIPIGLDECSYLETDPNLSLYFNKLFGERFFLFIGAFRYYKGLEYLLEAAKKTSARIVIVGSGSNKYKLWAMAQNSHLNNVFFLGTVSDYHKNSLLSACYGVIFPSNYRSEAFGVSLLEGAIFSKPLITCEIGTGTSFVNIHMKTGLVVPPSNAEALANAMTWLLKHSKEAKKMGQAARERYELEFTSAKMSQSYFDIYQNLLGSKIK